MRGVWTIHGLRQCFFACIRLDNDADIGLRVQSARRTTAQVKQLVNCTFADLLVLETLAGIACQNNVLDSLVRKARV